MTVNIAFFDSKPYDRQYFELANRDHGFCISFFETHLNAETAPLCQGHEAACIFVNDVADAAVLGQLKALGVKALALRCAGYNNVDLAAAAPELPVLRVPGYSPHAVAEHAAALMLSLNRHTYQAYHRTRDGNFSINGLLGFDLHGKTAGIVGAGQIGRCLVSILQGFGMEVLVYDTVHDREYEKRQQVSYVSLEEIYRRADIISLHCPLNDHTHHLIDQTAIDAMKPGVMIINTGRGKLIDTRALVRGLKARKIGAAGLDVYEEETSYFFEDRSLDFIADDVLARLLTFPNVLITSHQGFFTREALDNIARTTLENLRTYFSGGKRLNEVRAAP